MSRVLRFNGSTLVAAHDPLPVGASPDLADSFLFRDRRVRAFSLHRDRFRHDLEAIAPELLPQLNDFYRACAAELEEEYESFPRFDLSQGALWLRVRPLPTLSDTANAVTTTFDTATAERKGPNIATFTDLNRANNAETLRVDAQGIVLEGVTSALLWWEEGVLHHSASTNRIASTTELFLREEAARRGLSVQPATRTAAKLREHEVWLVNALHGIRTLTSLDGKTLPTPQDERLSTFRTAFESSWELLGSDSV